MNQVHTSTIHEPKVGMYRLVQAFLYGCISACGFFIITYAAEKALDVFPKIPIEYSFFAILAYGAGYAIGFGSGWRRVEPDQY